MRGLFFASVSHDLKSPLNAILGFAELVAHTERLSPGQSESLAPIERRGRELLALIETILDAARVEAGQLTLVHDSVTVSDLFGDAIAKGRDLGADRPVEVVAEIVEGIGILHVDRVRMGRALATFIGHALRTAEREFIRVRAVPSRKPGMIRIDVEAPSTPAG
jgi:signal transduction histidine kinase